MSASPKLAQALQQQLIAIDAIRSVDTPAPPELHERIQSTIRRARAQGTSPRQR